MLGSARVSHAGWLVAIAVAYLYVFPHFPTIRSANEYPRVYLIKSIVHEGSFAIDSSVKKYGTTADVSPSGGHIYSNKSPGSSFLVVPVYALVNAIAGEPSIDTTFWIARVVGGILPALAFLALLARFLARYAPEPNVRRLVLVTYALGSMAMTYSLIFIAHQLSAICVAGAWILALEAANRERGIGAFAAAGLLAGCAPLVDYQAAFAVVPLLVHVVITMRAWPRAELARAIGVAAVCALIPIAVLLAYHDACFGGPLRTGYDASQTFAHFHQQGFLGITRLRSEAFVGSTIAPHFGLFTLSPWLLLAFPGWVVLWKRGERAMAITTFVVLVIYVLFISSINFWRGGWSVGPRYITVALPFLLPPVAAALTAWRERRPALIGAAALMLVGVAIFCATSVTFPYWPEAFHNPIWELSFRLLGEGHVAPNVASALGLSSGLVGAVPWLLLVLVTFGLPLFRLVGWHGVAITVVAAAAILVAYRTFPATRDVNVPYGRVVAAMTRS